MKRTIVLVMMGLVLDMQNDVCKALAVLDRELALSHGERVPQQRDNHQKNGGRFAHGGNLAETHRSVEPAAARKGTEMLLIVTKYAVTSLVIVLVSEIAKRSDKVGARIASLPLVTVMVMIWLYVENQGTARIAQHAYYTFWYVLPTLPMFLAIPFLLYRGVNFWVALAAGMLLTLVAFGLTALAARHFNVSLVP